MKNAKYLDTEEENLIREIHEVGYEPVADMDTEITAFGDWVTFDLKRAEPDNDQLTR